MKIINLSASAEVNKEKNLNLDGLERTCYSSPEVAKNGKRDQMSDVWSIGIILNILLTGNPPKDQTTFQIENSNISKEA